MAAVTKVLSDALSVFRKLKNAQPIVQLRPLEYTAENRPLNACATHLTAPEQMNRSTTSPKICCFYLEKNIM